MDYRQQLRQNANTNYIRFENDLKSSTKENIYDKAYQIYAYGLMNDFLAEADDFLSYECMEFLNSKTDMVIDFLWETLSQTLYSAESHSDLRQLVQDLYDESMEAQTHSPKLSYKEQLSQNAEANYQRYEAQEFTKSKEEIYHNSYEISVYGEFFDYLTGNNELEEHICKSLCAEGEDILDRLFSEFSTTPQASINSCDDVYDFISQYSKMYFRNSDNKREIEM